MRGNNWAPGLLERMLHCAWCSGNMATIAWLRSQQAPWPSAINASGNVVWPLQSLRWAVEHGYVLEGWDSSVCRRLQESGRAKHLEILRWVHSLGLSRPCTCPVL